MTWLPPIEEGVRMQTYFHEGRYYDWCVFGLTKDEFVENGRKLTH